ncbi:MAG: N-acetyltransferase [Chitinophagia bacterium]|nr:N-acetyltransferase [Chitinophagia bacterium]
MTTLDVNHQIKLRTFTETDATLLFECIEQNRAHLTPWINWIAHATTYQHIVKFIKDSLHALSTQESMYLAIWYEDKLIGSLNIQDWHKKAKRAQIGYWISKEYEGKGIVTLCMHRLMTFMFRQMDINKIELHFTIKNTKSAQVAQRLGFTTEGIIRQSLVRNGIIEDLVIAGLLKQEWKNKNSI